MALRLRRCDAALVRRRRAIEELRCCIEQQQQRGARLARQMAVCLAGGLAREAAECSKALNQAQHILARSRAALHRHEAAYQGHLAVVDRLRRRQGRIREMLLQLC